MKRLVLAACWGLALATTALAAAGGLTPSDRAALQAAMYRHIDSQLVDGVFLHLNPGEGKITSLAPSKAHPVILRMGEHYVLCSNFRAPDGKYVNIDFYMARSGARYIVFHTEVGNRDSIETLMAQGKIALAE